MSVWRTFKESCICGIILWLGTTTTLVTPVVAADPGGQRINKVKAAFVLNIARFVTWPPEVFEDHIGRLLLCIYRTNPFDDALDSIRGEMVGGRQLDIIRVEKFADTDSCQILLIPLLELDVFAEETRSGMTRPLLTIADRIDAATEPAIEDGILVSLVRKGKHIRFEIDLGRTRKTGLKMSSELLKHAWIVGEDSWPW